MTTRGLRELQQALERISGGEIRRIMPPIAEQLHSSTIQRFEDSKAPSGRTWQAHAPRTQARRPGGKILVDNAQLKNSISTRVEGLTAYVGTNKPYAAIHQFGGRAGRNRAATIPARPFLGITDEDVRYAEEIVEDWLRDQL